MGLAAAAALAIFGHQAAVPATGLCVLAKTAIYIFLTGLHRFSRFI